MNRKEYNRYRREFKLEAVRFAAPNWLKRMAHELAKLQIAAPHQGGRLRAMAASNY
jgi:hypothetical protein